MRSKWNSDVPRWVPSTDWGLPPKPCLLEHYCDAAAAELQDEPASNTKQLKPNLAKIWHILSLDLELPLKIWASAIHINMGLMSK